MNLQKYNKLWVALTVAAGVLAFACSPDTEAKQLAFEVTRNEWYSIFAAFAGAFGVFGVANKK